MKETIYTKPNLLPDDFPSRVNDSIKITTNEEGQVVKIDRLAPIQQSIEIEGGSGAEIPVIDVLTQSMNITVFIPLLIDKLNAIDYKTPGNVLVRLYNDSSEYFVLSNVHPSLEDAGSGKLYMDGQTFVFILSNYAQIIISLKRENNVWGLGGIYRNALTPIN